jgi:(p)ppGpp synthase/HD superfamily hydrolase
MYTEKNNMLHRAIKVCIDAHKHQVDKAGELYYLHPMRICFYMDSYEEKIVALLHDVIEDSRYSMEDLKSEQFSSEILDAVLAMTRKGDEDYFDHIDRVLKNKIAKAVKIQDLKDNINLDRLRSANILITETDLVRTEKYRKALDILMFS